MRPVGAYSREDPTLFAGTMVQSAPSTTSIGCRTCNLLGTVCGRHLRCGDPQTYSTSKLYASWLAKARSVEYHREEKLPTVCFRFPFGIHSHTMDLIDGTLLLPIVSGIQNIDILPVLKLRTLSLLDRISHFRQPRVVGAEIVGIEVTEYSLFDSSKQE